MTTKKPLILSILFLETLFLSFTSSYESSPSCAYSYFEKQRTMHNTERLEAADLSVLLNFGEQPNIDSLIRVNSNDDYKRSKITMSSSNFRNYNGYSSIYQTTQMKEIPYYKEILAKKEEENWLVSFIDYWETY